MNRTLVMTMLMLTVHGAGCDDGDDDGGDDDGNAAPHCAEDDRDEPFTIGMSVGTEDLALKVVDADPVVPVRGDNTWMLELDAGNTPTPGATIEYRSWMPDHGHGSPKPTVITDEGDGSYAIDPVNLSMRGYWEITFSITPPESDAAEDVVFRVCVE